MARLAVATVAAMLLLCLPAQAEDAKPVVVNGISAPVPANEHIITAEDYPAISRAQHEEGSVILKILVTEDGHATDAQVVKSSGFPRLDQAAAETVMREWLYKPAIKDGRPIAVQLEVRVNFKMKPSEHSIMIKPEDPYLVVVMGPKDYPAAALAQKEEAVIGFMVVVSEDGKISMIRPTTAGGAPDLEQASMDIVKTWHLKPAERDGKPIKTVISPVFVWSLDPVPVKEAPTAAP